MNFRIHSILYFAIGIAFMALETIGAVWTGTAVKSLIIPVLIWLYLRFIRSKSNLFHCLVFTALVFSWIGDVVLQLVQFHEFFFLVGMGSFLVTRLIYLTAFFGTPGENTLFFRKVYLVLPVALYGWWIISLLSDGPGAMWLPVTAYTVVILGMVLAAINREKKVNRQSFLLVLSGAVLLAVSDSMTAINKFNQPFELARMAIMSSYLTAQYLIIVGCSRQYNLTIK